MYMTYASFSYCRVIRDEVDCYMYRTILTSILYILCVCDVRLFISACAHYGVVVFLLGCVFCIHTHAHMCVCVCVCVCIHIYMNEFVCVFMRSCVPCIVHTCAQSDFDPIPVSITHITCDMSVLSGSGLLGGQFIQFENFVRQRVRPDNRYLS